MARHILGCVCLGTDPRAKGKTLVPLVPGLRWQCPSRLQGRGRRRRLGSRTTEGEGGGGSGLLRRPSAGPRVLPAHTPAELHPTVEGQRTAVVPTLEWSDINGETHRRTGSSVDTDSTSGLMSGFIRPPRRVCIRSTTGLVDRGRGKRAGVFLGVRHLRVPVHVFSSHVCRPSPSACGLRPDPVRVSGRVAPRRTYERLDLVPTAGVSPLVNTSSPPPTATH